MFHALTARGCAFADVGLSSFASTAAPQLPPSYVASHQVVEHGDKFAPASSEGSDEDWDSDSDFDESRILSHPLQDEDGNDVFLPTLNGNMFDMDPDAKRKYLDDLNVYQAAVERATKALPNPVSFPNFRLEDMEAYARNSFWE